MTQHACISFLVLILFFTCALSENKYSRSANEKNTSGVNFRTLEKPFRMSKLNLVWIKAQQVIFMYSYLFTGKISLKKIKTSIFYSFLNMCLH